MPPASEWCHQPYLHDLQHKFSWNHAFTERKHIAVIMLASETSGLQIPAERASNTFYFVGDHGFTVARRAEYDSAIKFSARDRFSGGPNEERIIHGRFFAKGAEILEVMP